MWVLFALTASILNAFYYLVIQNTKINANLFMVSRSFVTIILLLPILIFYPVKFSLNFYLMTVLQGCIFSYTDYLSFRINKNYGSETVSSITPLTVIFVFIAWCFISPDTVVKYTENPVKSFGIVCALLGVVYALINYHKTPLTKKAFWLLIPVLCLISTTSVLNKLIMQYSGENPVLCACWRVFILTLTIGTIHLLIYKKKKLPIKAVFNIKNILRSSIFVIPLVVAILKSLAMLYTLNPAYVSCIVYLTIFWIILLSHCFRSLKFKKNHKLVAKKYEILFILSIIALILLTR